jgi:hypothetical protein
MIPIQRSQCEKLYATSDSEYPIFCKRQNCGDVKTIRGCRAWRSEYVEHSIFRAMELLWTDVTINSSKPTEHKTLK